MIDTYFEARFEALTGHEPFLWQRELFSRMIYGQTPDLCDIQTGLGKTSVMVVWLIALEYHLREGTSFPRRLVYIVDRRTVIDQASIEAEALLARLLDEDACQVVKDMRVTLTAASVRGESSPLAISTLRGQRADNQHWFRDPTRPAIIISTVDMAGSRILFSGYGASKYKRPLQAGLLLCDSLIALDEAHLVPPFEDLLYRVKSQLSGHPVLRPFVLMLLSATGRNVHPGISKLSLDLINETPEAQKRVRASKTLHLCYAEASENAKDSEKKNAYYTEILSRIKQCVRGTASTLVYLNTIDDVLAIEGLLRKEGIKQIVVLTGEMRGKEREAFLVHEKLDAFRPNRPPQTKPHVLITTASGEVGVNWDADHLVCDLVTLERMIQRFGRVNRLGNGVSNIFVVVAPGELTQDNSLFHVLDALRDLPVVAGGWNASPGAVHDLIHNSKDYSRAFARAAMTIPLDESELDDWALTSISADEYPRPDVKYWLRGLDPEKDLAVDFVWRADLEFAESDGDPRDAILMAKAILLAPAEIASVALHRAKQLLRALEETRPLEETNGETLRVVVLFADGQWDVKTIRDINDKRFGDYLVGSTLFLPTQAKGLVNGLPDFQCSSEVPDAVNALKYARYLAVLDEEEGQWDVWPLGDSLSDPPKRSVPDTGKWPKKLGIPNITHISGSDASSKRIIYAELEDEAGLSVENPSDVPLSSHTAEIERVARKMAELLRLGPDLTQAVVLAALYHDRGKLRLWWQAAIGNTTAEPLAKSTRRYFDHDLNKGYRHEFGSLIDAIEELPKSDIKDLVLHLVAAHHGNARPGFTEDQFSRLSTEVPVDQLRQINRESAERYVRLQRQHGWWTLAYLEALLKSSDIIASL